MAATKNNLSFKAFLSYISSDREIAGKLKKLLSNRDDVRLNDGELKEGEDWQTRLSEDLRNSDVFIVIVSPNSLRHPWILQELGFAWGTGKAIVPIKTSPDLKLPVSLDGLVTFELRDALKAENWDKILNAFEGVLRGNSFNFLTSNPLS